MTPNRISSSIQAIGAILQIILRVQMGNTNNGQSHLQHFYQACHPGLVQYQFDEKQQLLSAQVKVEESFLIWRKLVDPLLNKKQLFMPIKIIAPEYVTDYGCCAQEDFHRSELQSKSIYYEPFVFTLDREIGSRKLKNVGFREQEMWKVLKYVVRAVLEWQEVYPLEPVGSICPFNLIIDPQGQVRLVCRLSFFNNQYAHASEVYSPPESRENSIIKYSLNPSKDPIGIESSAVYSIGMVMLQTATLQVSGVSSLQTQDKLILLGRSVFSADLKGIVNAMLDHNQSVRPKLHYLLEQAKYHRTRRI